MNQKEAEQLIKQFIEDVTSKIEPEKIETLGFEEALRRMLEGGCVMNMADGKMYRIDKIDAVPWYRDLCRWYNTDHEWRSARVQMSDMLNACFMAVEEP